MATLYIGDLGMEADESDIYDLFRGFDVRAVHMKFRYCFVTFVDTEQASLAIALNGADIFGRRIRIEWARSSYDRRWDHDCWGSEPELGRPGNGNSIGYTQNRPQNVSNSASSLASSASSQSSASPSHQPVPENTLLECEICFVRFDYHAHRPRSLPCGHSLCSLCITDTLRANQDNENPCLLCPFCRTSCGLHKTRVGQFPETFFILKMLEVEAVKAKKGDQKVNEEFEKKEREMEEKRREEMKKEKEKKEKEKKEQEEEYLKFQKQIGLDSTVSGLISCIDHLESLKDLHKQQLAMKSQLKTERKKLLEEVGKVESEIMELSEQMFNTEVWIASGNNLMSKFDNIQENLKEDNKENIESCYDAAERCCRATQRWSEESLPEIHKMNLFMKQMQEGSSNGSMSPSDAASCDFSDRGTLVKFACTEGTDTVYKCGESEELKTKFNVITQMKEYLNISFEELRLQYYLYNPCKCCSVSGFGLTQKCSTCSNELVGTTALSSRAIENKGVLELTEALGKFNKIPGISSDAGATSSLSASGSRQSLRSPRKILKRSKLGFLFEKTPEDVPDIGSELEISSEEPENTLTVSTTGDNCTTESTTRTFTPFVVTNTSPSFNFGSTINPFQKFNLLGTTTAVSSKSLSSSDSSTSVASIAPLSAVEMTSNIGSATKLSSSVTSDITNVSPSFNFGCTINPFQTFNLPGSTTAVSSKSLFSSISATSVASVAPLLAVETRSSIGSSTQLTSSVTSDSVKSIVSITQTVSGTTNSTTQFTSLTNSAKATVANISQTNVTSALRLGNSYSLTNTSANMNIINSSVNNVPTNTPNLNFIASSVRPLFSSCETSTVSSPFSMGNLSHPSRNRNSNIPTSVAEAAKQITVEDYSLASNSSESIRPKVNSAYGLTGVLIPFPKELNFSAFKLVNSSESVKSDANNVTLPTAAFTKTTTTTTTNTGTAYKSMTLISSASSSLLPDELLGVRSIGTMTSDCSSSSVSTSMAAVTLATTSQTSEGVFTPVYTVYSPLVLSAVSTGNKSSVDNSLSNVTNCFKCIDTDGTGTVKCSTASASVRPKIFSTTPSQISLSNIDSKYTAIITEDKRRRNIFSKDCKLSSESNCDDDDDDGCTKSLPSYTYTMSSGMFSGISITPSTSTKTTNSDNSTYLTTNSTAIITEDGKRQNSISKDSKLSKESSFVNRSTKILPSFTFTPGRFSRISFPPYTSTNTIANSDNAMSSAGLSFVNSTHSTTNTTVPTTSSFNFESIYTPISFRLKPKAVNFFSILPVDKSPTDK